MDLGSGVKISIAPPFNNVRLFNLKNSKKKNYPEAPPPVTINEVDGVEIKVERLPIRYEKLEDIMDELPDFVQTLLQERLENENNH